MTSMIVFIRPGGGWLAALRQFDAAPSLAFRTPLYILGNDVR